MNYSLARLRAAPPHFVTPRFIRSNIQIQSVTSNYLSSIDTSISSVGFVNPPAFMLKVQSGIPRGVAQQHEPRSEYIAVRSVPEYFPELPWTLFKTKKSLEVAADDVWVGNTPGLGLPVPCLTQAVDPIKLTHIILSAPGHLYDNLAAKKEGLKSKLPPVIRQGDFLEDLLCRVRACDPVEQGVMTDETVISVVKDQESTAQEEEADYGVEISQFLQTEVDVIELKVKTLEHMIPLSGIIPRPSPTEDLESVVFMRIDQIARLGAFSGDLVQVTSDTGSRILRLYSYPEPNNASSEFIFLPPVLSYNMGSPTKVSVQRCTEDHSFAVAKDVTLARIASPISTNRTYQQAFLSGLRSYFENSARIVKQNDVIAVPIDTLLAQTTFSSNTEEEVPALSGKANEIVWFKIAALDGGDSDDQFSISPAHTRMVQSGFVSEPCVPSSLGWHSYYNLKPLPPLLANPEQFKHVWQVRKLVKASQTPRGTTLHPTILLSSSKRGAGKSTTLRVVAADLGVHEMDIDCYQLVGDADAKTLGALKARLERASSSIAPCLVVFRHIEALAKKNDTDGRDSGLISSLGELLDEYIAKPGMIITATCADPDVLSDSVRNKFKFEVNVPVISEAERKAVFAHLTSSVLPASRLAGKHRDVLEGFALRCDVSLASLALQSAGLTPPDLESIIRVAQQQAYRRIVKETNPWDWIISQKGVIKITPDDFEKAITDARAKYSDSIGAPRIPNVQWKDVGGLENVKGEIMDTIEMPLKYPQLFASGVKKRSGILFYGPPGTGKTLLAKAIATTFSLNFFSVKGPELLNMYIGESEANVRRVFQKARDAKPCVVFFDELDSVAPKRGNKGDSGGVMDRIVSQLLAELDGMSQGSDGVFVIGATNRPDLLDEALLRPGRFDKMLYLGVSDTHDKQRTIIEALTRKFDLAADVDLAQVAEKCPFTYTGADFYALSSDAMLNAMTRTAGEVDLKIAEYNKAREASGQPPITIRSWFEHVATDEDTHVQVTVADFEKAQNDLVPSVSADELAHYQRVRNTFEAKATSPEPNGQTNGANSAKREKLLPNGKVKI